MSKICYTGKPVIQLYRIFSMLINRFMKKIALPLIGLCSLLLLLSCSEDRDDIQISNNLEIKNFIYSAMNIYYLYKPDVPVLANDFFDSQADLNVYLDPFNTPEDLYEDLLSNADRFSFMTDDYRELENRFAGVSKDNGLEYRLVRVSPGSDEIIGYVRYIIPNSNASTKDIKRGDAFTKVNNTPLTITNYLDLLALDTYTLTLADLTDTGNAVSITENGRSVTLTKEEGLIENPILIAKTLNISGQKIGYLMYNAYTADFDDELNAAFAQFKTDGITDLVLDLRYNGGGSVESAIDLTSMITGQFNGEVITKQQWNPEIQAAFEAEDPEALIDRFNNTIRTGESINSLNLGRLFVIGTGSTASASELTIIGLKPYINVQTIGTTTVGKFQASTTLYDSENFSRQNVNPNHFYAIQPLIYTYANSAGTVGPPTGIEPDFEIAERASNLGVLGDPNEPLLKMALDQILGRSASTKSFENTTHLETVGESKMFNPDFQRMYVLDLPKS